MSEIFKSFYSFMHLTYLHRFQQISNFYKNIGRGMIMQERLRHYLIVLLYIINFSGLLKASVHYIWSLVRNSKKKQAWCKIFMMDFTEAKISEPVSYHHSLGNN